MIVRVVVWSIAGWAMSALVVFALPRSPHTYQSHAVMDVHESPGRVVPLAPIHAGILVSQLDLTERWGCSFEEAMKRVQAETRLTATKEGVEIRVTCNDRLDARDMARYFAANLFRSMDRELALSDRKPILPLPPEIEKKRAEDFKFLTFMLHNQAAKAGIEDYEGVESRAAAGSDEDQKLWASEEFQRHWRAFQNLPQIPRQSVEEPDPPPRMLVQPQWGSPVADGFERTVRLTACGGICFGLGIGFWRGRRASLRMKAAGLDEADQMASDGHPDLAWEKQDSKPSRSSSNAGTTEEDW